MRVRIASSALTRKTVLLNPIIQTERGITMDMIMKRLLLFIVALCVIFFFAFFTLNKNDCVQQYDVSDVVDHPNVTVYGSGLYTYVVDENTGVVYLQYDGGRKCGLSVMLNQDGTPVTRDQLGIQ